MYHVEWIVANRIVLLQGVGDQTIETVSDSATRLTKFLTAGSPPVHVLSDLRYLGSFPTNLKTLQRFMVNHENSGQVLVIGGNALAKFVSKALTRFSGGAAVTFKDSIAEAIEFLQRLDTTLPEAINYPERSPNDP